MCLGTIDLGSEVFGPETLLPARALLLHIGPHKTATTAIQNSLRQSSDAMKRHGVTYASPGRVASRLAALAATGLAGLRGDRVAAQEHWLALRQDVSDAPEDHRVVVSSEFFCGASPEAARRIVSDLGGERVHVVVTLRHLGKILPSSWQQYVRNRTRYDYAYWLEHTLNGKPFTSPTASFWRRHRHDALIGRWASIVGPESVAVVVLDESDRTMPYRSFEQMTGLPTGLLGESTDLANRSLTAAEVELMRQLNYLAVEEGWSDRAFHKLVKGGVTASMQRVRPGSDEALITTPQWALDRASEIGSGFAAGISELGVRVIGDISSLGAPLRSAVEGDPVTPTVVPIHRAKEGIAGAIRASGRLAPRKNAAPTAPAPVPTAPPPTGDDRPVTSVPSGELAKVIVRRAFRRLR
jgi:hypothetical protein